MRTTTKKKTCKECGGLRHGSQCMCRTGVQTIMGCCTTCNGSGKVEGSEDICESEVRDYYEGRAIFQFAC